MFSGSIRYLHSVTANVWILIADQYGDIFVAFQVSLKPYPTPNRFPLKLPPRVNLTSVIFLDCIFNGPPADHWLSNPPACVSLHAVQQKKESTSRWYHYLSPQYNIRPPCIEEITITVLNPHQSHHHHQRTTGGMVWPLLGPESCGEVSWELRRREAQLYSNVLLACYMYSSSSTTVQYSEIVKQCRIFFLIELRVQSRSFL